MNILINLQRDEKKKKSYQDELRKYRIMLERRAKAFVDGAKDSGLVSLPYFGGFFISIPCENPKMVQEKLKEDNFYIVANKNGLRFAVCAVNEEKCRNSAKIIKNAIDKLNK